MGYRTLSRDTLQNGVSHRCACVKLSTKGGVSYHFGGVLTSLEKVSRDVGYRSDSTAISRDMGPLRAARNCGTTKKGGIMGGEEGIPRPTDRGLLSQKQSTHLRSMIEYPQMWGWPLLKGCFRWLAFTRVQVLRENKQVLRETRLISLVLVVSNLVVCNFTRKRSFAPLFFALFCALLHSFALFADLRLRSFAFVLFLRVSASDRV